MITKVVFVTNYYNDHLKEFCDELFNIFSYDFIFIETEKNKEHFEKSRMASPKPSYVVRYSEVLSSLLIEADYLIFGSAPFNIIKKRIYLDKKKTFLYQERPLKKGLEPLKYVFRYIKWHRRYSRKRNCYVLCASSFVSSDYKKFGLFNGKCIRFGYFPNRYKANIAFDCKTIDSLFVARLVKLKHPEIYVSLCAEMVKINPLFSGLVVGDGPLYGQIKHMLFELGIDNNVKMLGFVNNVEVLDIMKKSKSIVFCSDSREGWGAVINESMSCGCVPFVSDKIGSTGFLIKDDENGFRFSSIKELISKYKYYYSLPLTDSIKLSDKAKETINYEWNGIVAAQRFAEIVKDFNNIHKFRSGPMSLIVKD